MLNRKYSAKMMGGILAAALTMSAVSTGFAYADTKLSVSETEVETEKEEETEEKEEETEKREYTQLETTDTSEAAVMAIDVSNIVEEVMPSIVTISEKTVAEIESYFGGTQQVEVEGAASGFIIAQNDDELLIATNNHVVEDATDVTICFSVDVEDQDELLVPAKVKGADPGTDVAVVAVQLSDIPDEVLKELKIAVLGNSDNIKVGQTAITIGNTLGWGLTVTSGIVAAVNVELELDGHKWTEFETDGAANQGQSGGPVLNKNGEVIGIFNAGATEGDNVGYAVPISSAIPVLQELINRKTRDALDEYGYMGVTVAAVSDEASSMYDIPQGAYVYSVEKGSAADKAGLEKGDVITRFDGVTISTRDSLLKQITYYEAGETVELTIQRPEGNKYKEETVEITLDEPSEEVKKAREQQRQSASNSTVIGSDDDGSSFPWGQIFGDGSDQTGEQDEDDF